MLHLAVILIGYLKMHLVLHRFIALSGWSIRPHLNGISLAVETSKYHVRTLEMESKSGTPQPKSDMFYATA